MAEATGTAQAAAQADGLTADEVKSFRGMQKLIDNWKAEIGQVRATNQQILDALGRFAASSQQETYRDNSGRFTSRGGGDEWEQTETQVTQNQSKRIATPEEQGRVFQKAFREFKMDLLADGVPEHSKVAERVWNFVVDEANRMKINQIAGRYRVNPDLSDVDQTVGMLNLINDHLTREALSTAAAGTLDAAPTTTTKADAVISGSGATGAALPPDLDAIADPDEFRQAAMKAGMWRDNPDDPSRGGYGKRK